MFRYTQPLLSADFQPMIVRAHRERGSVMSDLLAALSRLFAVAAQ